MTDLRDNTTLMSVFCRLADGHELSQLNVLKLCNTTALRARVSDLKGMGWNVKSRRIGGVTANGRPNMAVVYYMEPRERLRANAYRMKRAA